MAIIVLSLATAKFLHYTYPGREAILQVGNGTKLILFLDGVSFETIATLHEKGYFRMFRRPTRVIVPFPSMTNLAAAEIWHTKLPAGYEALYFDRQNNSLVGGEGSYLQKRRLQAGDYHTLLDYVEPKAYEFIVYGFPERTNRADLRRFLLAYSTSDQKVFRAFLKSTDGLAHVGGREALERALIELDGVLRKLRENSGSDLEITLFSDHGNSYTRSQPIDVEGHLQRNGFRMDDKLEGEESVVIPGFGLVNYAALYTAPDRKRHVAEVLSRLEEVDVVAYQESGVIHVLSRKGRAQIHYRQESDSYRYLGLSGDPLKLAAIQAQLMNEGTMTAYGYIADRVWFEALAEHEFPDVVFRIHQAVNGLVQNKADVLVSFKPGYAYGNRLSESFNRFAPVAAFHGGLVAEQSHAFFMSTHQQTPPVIRARDVMSYF